METIQIQQMPHREIGIVTAEIKELKRTATLDAWRGERVSTQAVIYSGRDTDKFEGIEPLVKGYLPVLPQAMSYITCKVINTMETETHTIFLGEVTDAGNLATDTPMTYKYYHEVVKGTAPKNAPTYSGD